MIQKLVNSILGSPIMAPLHTSIRAMAMPVMAMSYVVFFSFIPPVRFSAHSDQYLKVYFQTCPSPYHLLYMIWKASPSVTGWVSMP